MFCSTQILKAKQRGEQKEVEGNSTNLGGGSGQEVDAAPGCHGMAFYLRDEFPVESSVCAATLIAGIMGSVYCILLCIMRPYIFGSNFQEKKSFVLIF